MNLPNKQSGFTLIELMIVVAIVGILAAVAIPQYNDYVTRSRWATAVAGTGAIKSAIAMCSQENNQDLTLCDTTAEIGLAGLPTAANLAGATPTITTTTAAIVLTGDTKLNSCVITQTPTVSNGVISWVVSNDTSKTGCTKSRTGF